MSKIVKSEAKLSTREKKMIHNFESMQKASKRFQASLQDFFSTKKVAPVKTEKTVEKQSKVTANDIALEGLKLIGHPVTVKQFVSNMIKMKPKLPSELRAALPPRKKFTQIMYNAMSNLSSLGEVKRKVYDRKTFEYKLA